MNKATLPSKKNKPKFKFNKNQVIGAPDAETDRLLHDCFIDNGAYDVLRDTSSSKCILIGRTGSGKSALLKRLLEYELNVVRIAPESMSLKYLSNSTILNYLRALGVNLNFFYKVLWKHVFIVEILKLYIGDEETKRRTFFQRITSIVNAGNKKNLAKRKAVDYLENWTDEFWLKTEYRIKELSEQLQDKIKTQVGADLDLLKSEVGSEKTVSTEKKAEIKHKAETIISEIQADELYDLIELLSDEIFYHDQKKYYIVIDDLDKEWVSPQIVYDLIAAMVEIIKEFQEKFKGVKIIIGLRDNLHNIIFSGKQHRGGQREKYSSLYMSLAWEKEDLKALVDRRLKVLSHNSMNIENLFDKKNGLKTGFDYMVERTFYRPRDIISFFNHVIEKSNNKSHIQQSAIKDAETYYSMERFEALIDEWEENYGNIAGVCSFLLGIHNGFNLINVKEDKFAEIIVENDFINSFKGDLFDICYKWKSSNCKPPDFREFISELFSILYKIGIIGIKKRPEMPVTFFYDRIANITANDFDNNVKIYVHKALYSYFKINVKEQEDDYFGH